MIFQRTERGEQGGEGEVSETELKDVISTMEKILAAELAEVCFNLFIICNTIRLL